MEHSFRSFLILLAGLACLVTGIALNAIILEPGIWTLLLQAVGAGLTAFGLYQLRSELAGLIRQRRGEIAIFTVGVIGILVVIAYFSTRYTVRYDLSESRMHSLSDQTVTMLQKLENPVEITFFHDSGMRETIERYELIAAQTDKVTVEFFDPMVNPAQARMRGVQFAGTALLKSGEREMQVHGPEEADIANAILRISLGAQQTACFLDGHGEADPFSKEAHDHLEGAAGHSHGAGSKMVIHETHGMAKARHGLEALNYVVEKTGLMRGNRSMSHCAVLVIAGPKTKLLPDEIESISDYLDNGGNVFFMLDPFVETGLEPIVRRYGIVVDNNIVLDPLSHFWADPSSPAVTRYGYHQITRGLPLTFYPGVRSLSPTEKIPGTSVVPLVNSSQESFGESNPESVRFDAGQDAAGPLTLMVTSALRPEQAVEETALLSTASEGDLPSPVIEGRANSRIVVIGDSDFATNSFFHLLGNGNIFLNAVNFLAEQENLIGIEPKTYDPPRVNLTNRQMKGVFVISVVLIPALLAIIGFAVWWRQR
ncbi:MAG: GldG family protein [Betaproteobacteria bacterium]|nr:MAG: GldG family protein [Betaproteobacteria bacterium]